MSACAPQGADFRSLTGAWLVLLAGLAATSPVSAEIGTSLSLASEQMFRGRSISQGRPTAGIDISYDHSSGFYVGGQGRFVYARGDDVRWLSATSYAGYAWRARPDLTIDLGVVDTRFSSYSSLGRSTGYDEATIGLIGRHLSARVSVSPNWFGPNLYTGYGEAAAMIGSRTGWRLTLHGGVLTWLYGPRAPVVPRTRYDYRLGIGRTVGRFELEAAWVGTGARPDFYAGRTRGHGRIVATLAARL